MPVRLITYKNSSPALLQEDSVFAVNLPLPKKFILFLIADEAKITDLPKSIRCTDRFPGLVRALASPRIPSSSDHFEDVTR